MRIGVVTFPGSLDDHDAARAVRSCGGEAVSLWHRDADLHGVDAVVLPGGFSYGDYLRAGAISRFAPVMDVLVPAAQGGLPVLGICNGFQILCESHLLPGAMIQNDHRTFVCRDQRLRVETSDTVWTHSFEPKAEITIPVLEDDGLEVVAYELDVEQAVIDDMDVFLSEAERRRAERLKSDRQRRRFVASRGQLRRILASRLGISPSDVELEYGQQGKPHLSHRMPSRNLRFSVSRSQDVAVIALSTGQEVGVDIEAVLPIPEADDIAALCFSASDYESYAALGPDDRLEGFFRRWTRLEAISKGLGFGLGYPGSSDEEDWVVRSFVPKTGYLGCVVVRK